MRTVPSVVIIIGLALCLNQFCWAQSDKQADKIIEDCQKSVKAANDNYEAQQQKAEAQRNDELSKAESQRDKTVSAAKEDALKKLVTIIDRQAEASDFEGVLETWKLMADVDPDHGISSAMMGKKARGILMIARVFEQKDISVEAILQQYREETRQAQQKHDRTVQSSEAELNRSRQQAKGKVLPLLVKIAEERAKAGDADGSIAAWKAVLEVDPEHAQALRVLKASGLLEVPASKDEGKGWHDVLNLVDPATHVVGGTLKREGDAVVLEGHWPRFVIPVVPKGDYEFEYKFSGKSDWGLGAYLYIGSGVVAVKIDKKACEVSLPDGVGTYAVQKPLDEEDTRADKIKTVLWRVTLSEGKMEITGLLNGNAILVWKGPRKPTTFDAYTKPPAEALGFYSKWPVVKIHEAKIRMLKGNAEGLVWK